MKVQIPNRVDFLRYFLSPVSKIAENATIKIKSGKMSSIVCSSDSSVFLNCVCNDITFTDDDETTLNIPDVGKLLNAINSLPNDSIDFTIEDKKIKYISDTISFKVHLLEDGIISTPAVNIDKLKSIDFDCSFTMSYDDLQTLVKGSTFATDTNKVYLEMAGDSVRADLRDADNEYINNFSTVISKKVTGEPLKQPTPLTFEAIRMILGIRFDQCVVHFSNKVGVFLFDISNKSHKINYIVSALRR